MKVFHFIRLLIIPKMYQITPQWNWRFVKLHLSKLRATASSLGIENCPFASRPLYGYPFSVCVSVCLSVFALLRDGQADLYEIFRAPRSHPWECIFLKSAKKNNPLGHCARKRVEKRDKMSKKLAFSIFDFFHVWHTWINSIFCDEPESRLVMGKFGLFLTPNWEQ